MENTNFTNEKIVRKKRKYESRLLNTMWFNHFSAVQHITEGKTWVWLYVFNHGHSDHCQSSPTITALISNRETAAWLLVWIRFSHHLWVILILRWFTDFMVVWLLGAWLDLSKDYSTICWYRCVTTAHIQLILHTVDISFIIFYTHTQI